MQRHRKDDHGIAVSLDCWVRVRRGVEASEDVAERKALLREIGYKLRGEPTQGV